MKREKWITLFTSSLLAYLLSFAGTACIASAFGLEDNLLVKQMQLMLYCAVFSLLTSACCTWRFGYALPILLIGMTAIFQIYFDLDDSVETLLNIITTRYHKAYGWNVIIGANAQLTDTTVALQWIASFLSAMAAYSACRKRACFWAIFGGLLALFPCTLVLSTVPSEKWLFLLLLAMILLLLTQSVRKNDVYAASKLTLLFLLPVALSLTLLFSVVTPEGYVRNKLADQFLEKIELFMRDSSQPGEATVRQSIELETLTPQKYSAVPVMDITATRSEVYYLRGRAYDTYTGTAWSDSGEPCWPIWRTNGKQVSTVTVETRSVEDILYLPYYSSPMKNQQASAYFKNQEHLQAYTFECYTPMRDIAYHYTDSEYFIPLTDLPTDVEMWAYKFLKENHLSELEEIADFVKNSAVYDLNTPIMDAEYSDFTQWFLEESETGYCVHFATAAAVLLRSCGIPTRYVTGYVVQATANERVTVYRKDAHAWVEYYTPDIGWQILDPTPIVLDELPNVSEAESQTQESSSEAEEELQQTTKETTVATTQDLTKKTTQNSSTSDNEPTVNEQKQNGAFQTALDILLVFAIALFPVAVAILQWKVRVALRNRHCRRGTSNSRALHSWKHACRYCKALGIEPDPKLYRLAQKARFSQHVITHEELRYFEHINRSYINKLRQAPWYRRLYHQFILALY